MLQVYAGSVKDLISKNINDSNFCKADRTALKTQHESDMIETKPRINRMRQPWTAVSSWLALVRTVKHSKK